MTFKGKRRVSCDDLGWDDEFKKGAWTAEEDTVLRTAVYVSARDLLSSRIRPHDTALLCILACRCCQYGAARSSSSDTSAAPAQRQGRPGNWTDIARDIPGRSGKSCRLRWCNQLDPAVKKEPFGDWEDAVIIRGWQVNYALLVFLDSRRSAADLLGFSGVCTGSRLCRSTCAFACTAWSEPPLLAPV